MPTASSFAWKTESQDAAALQIKERMLSTYDWSWHIRATPTIVAHSGFTAGSWRRSVLSIRLTAWLQKFKEAGGTVREIDVWAESPRLSPLWLSASSSARHGLLIITVITPLPTKPVYKNARELKLANAAITDMQMRQRDVAALDAKYTKELADAKAENDARVMMLPLVVVGCTSKQSVSQCVKPPPPPAW